LTIWQFQSEVLLAGMVDDLARRGTRHLVSKAWLIFCEAFGLTIFIFGLLVWGYVVVIQVTHPCWLTDTLSHHAFPLLNWRVDDVGMIGFAIAPLGFLMWYLSCAYSQNSRREKK